ncbi:unnamed protein product [Bursaphelenchus okinawaensis]|uniref:DUF4440 domain-containing protein n=1 Tax=Bursaphelenchus okinawaensis TaxID=465554 RepID=A0A811KGQ9_9BILA|nr:unnamed protein product [Bursaphelenchus okinawaensis]CAG9102634.1 unnamed protein product [Bursaphelenchus okinawaensis]
MGLSQDEVEKQIQAVEKIQEDGVNNQDLKAIASTYAENAVLIHLGHSVTHGLENIAEGFRPFFGKTLTTEKQAAYDINNGEYLMRKGRYCFPGEKWNRFMQLHQRQPDGSYKIIHDEFDY